MNVDPFELPTQDVGIDGSPMPTSLPRAGGTPSWRALGAVAVAIIALVGVYALGQSGSPVPNATPLPAAAPDSPTDPSLVAPTPTMAPTPEPPPELVDLLGEGVILAEFDLGNRSRAIVWCRESVPGTQISSTLALIHVATSIRFGDQVVLYEELTKPWMPGGSGRRGRVLETEGLGAGNFASDTSSDIPADFGDAPTGERCESCAPERVSLGGDDVLVGACQHGVPFGAGIVYAIAPAVRPGQTPLALHVDCGITRFQVADGRLIIEGEAPLVRGLHEARFPLPAISFDRDIGRFFADDLELLDWNCAVDRSTQLADNHLLRTEPNRSMSYEATDSTIGEIGVHGPMVLGLTSEQCSMLTRAWWGQPSLDDPTGTPIADLVGLAPPEGERDWFYSCHRT